MNIAALLRLATFFLIAVVAFWAVWKLEALSYIYDIRMDDKGIEFILLSTVRVYTLPFSEIEYIEKTNGGYTILFAYSFKNRLFRSTYLIKKNRGLFTDKILVTPKNADDFEKTLSHAGILLKNTEVK